MAKTAQRKSRISPKAEEAFADYVALGPDRSYRALAAEYVKQNRYKTETTAFNAIAKWAGKYRWQDRIAEAANARSSEMLEAAAELDAGTFLETSRLLNERIGHTSPLQLDAVIKMRESVRKPAPKGGTNVNVSVSIEVERVVERIAEEDGLTEDEKRELLERLSSRVAGRR